MMRFVSIFGAALLFPFAGQATTVDVTNLEQLNEICLGQNFQEIVQPDGSVVFHCPSKIELPHGYKVVSTHNREVSLTAHSGIVLRGSNAIGSASNPISLRSYAVELSVNNNTATGIDYQNNHTTIYGNLTSDHPMTLENVLVKGDVTLNGSTLAVTGQYNTVIGNITTLSTSTLTNTNICGDIKSSGHLFEINTSAPLGDHYIVGDISALHSLNIQDISVFGKIRSEGLTGYLEGAFYDTELAIETFQPLVLPNNTEVCGDIKSYGDKPSNIQLYCGIDQSNCDYSALSCPITSVDIPVCDMLPPQEDDYELTISPEDDLALMCGDEPPTFTINTKNNAIGESLQVQLSIADSDFFDVIMISGASQDSTNPWLFTSNDSGELVVQIKVKTSQIENVDFDKTYSVTAELVTDRTQSKLAEFKFKPFIFEAYSLDPGIPVGEIQVVAGKPETINTRILACTEEGEAVEASNYSAIPTITPSVVSPTNGSLGDLNYQPEFKHGVSNASLITYESGSFNIQLTDTFDCTGFAKCPESGHSEVTGQFLVQSRPWTFAICPNGENAALPSGTSSDGAGFVAASELFSLFTKPIVWQSGGSLSDPINTTAYCGDSIRVTSNFMNYGSPSASIKLSSEQHTPTQNAANQTVLLEGLMGLSKLNHQNTGLGYVFDQLYWNEVGSLTIKVDVANSDINQGYRHVGRFYPKHFKVINQNWEYPSGQSFVYMNQPLTSVSYTVVALNANKSDVTNYAYFAPKKQQNFTLGELSNYTNRFVPPSPTQVQWSDLASRSIGTFLIKSSASKYDCSNSACWEKDDIGGSYPDGPFNTGSHATLSKIGLTYLSKVDKFEFFDDSHILTTQPDVRFGRLKFRDVGGPQGQQIKVPLDVEYWENGRFNTNFSDSQTGFDSTHSRSDTLWPSGSSSTASLSGDGKLVVGRTLQVFASQTVPAREQVKFYLDLADGANSVPWLRYNWDSSANGEEDPPVVVTFGINRGNDRVIYRGEPNLIGVN
ncbi:hypothetical protein BI375_02340 [Vibrio rotiferianus]|uniref:DUF6701 domain-containing protein n=1 Tax=Vibrio rotiferianus TaxID=190895 RepID=A0ABX3DFX9_9VIBR|nr:DUF6701 domain-containing protein [Vibrio rotiferianus]OHY96373.1 hypothetical protein BI375_02340 [Vibrio rotiferianus]